MPVNLNRLQEDGEDEEVVNNMEQLAISKPEPGKYGPPRYVHPDISRYYPSKYSFPPIFIWDQVRSSTFTYMFFCALPLFFFPSLLSYDLLGIFVTRLVLVLSFYSRSPNRLHVLGI